MADFDKWARGLPLPVKGVGRRAARLVDPLFIRRYRRASGDDRPVPPVKLRLGGGHGTSVPNYFEGGDRTGDQVADALERVGKPLTGGGKLLDLGCGTGRVSQRLLQLAGPESGLDLHGCDVDGLAAQWAQATLPGEFRVSNFAPPLPYENDSFDVVIAVSVFTHLDEKRQDVWLQEVKRVLKPDGVAALSTGGQALLDRVIRPGATTNSQDCTTRLRSHDGVPDDGILFEPYVRNWANADGMRGADEGYGATFHGAAYIHGHWSNWFVIDRIVEGAFNGTQDLVVARPTS